jgi:hypothetical protein
MLAPREPANVFLPILVDELGGTLAGVWLPEDRRQRWYVVPTGIGWELVIRWLVEQAIPEYVPGALRRVRAPELVDDELLTRAELEARRALERFDASVEAERIRLEAELSAARAAVEPLRFDLFYGTGSGLVAAVGQVLESAGFVTEDLDATFGEGVSADLLASVDDRHWLIEVKSSTGRASEAFVDDLTRHLATWSQLGREETLSGGALIVNHQRNEPPLDREVAVYTRPEFLAALEYPVIPTTALFAWWRDSKSDAVKDAVTGPGRAIASDLRHRALGGIGESRRSRSGE